ncbi:nuclear transport factor 2 family protein [Saccharopolyspora sp. K220]|uniref:YybH family protein n=1 Tax=Saccharopolyspora soli TaxID=2926618 RepID=UPI001F582ED5|nr:nuclear transport factor 2 family protein [Saccharopolyspora soli]MCI2418755.1 nuclear transport factor 2 family protein [Saccharopolyspora soli]
MSDAYPLATEPEGIVAALLARFNSGEVNAMMGLYAPGAVFITEAGETLTEQDQIAEELKGFLSLGLPMVATARHLFVADDIVQIVLDWSLDGIGPDGAHLHLGGVASDIARRGADGYWRYLIDNPYGTQVRTGG